MNVIIPLILIFALICYYYRHKEQAARKVFCFAMIVLCALLAVRYEFGPDYFSYRSIYFAIQGEDISIYQGHGSAAEKPFLRFLQMFPSYTLFVIFLTVFWLGSNIYFINKYVEARYYWFILIYFAIDPNNLMLGSVAMRSTLCAAIFLIALEFLLRGKRIFYVLLMLAASLFHTSALALVPLVLVNTKKMDIFFNSTFCYVWGGIALINFVTGANDLIIRLSQFVMENIEELQRYQEQEIGSSGQSINTFLFRLMSFLILLYINYSMSKENDGRYTILYKIAFVAALFPLILGQSLISDRFLLILNPVYVCILMRSIKKNDMNTKNIVLLFVLIISSYMFYSKMGKAYSQSFIEYHTIFSAPRIP